MTSPRRTGGEPTPTSGRSHGPFLTPLQLSSFVGRERELAEVGDLLGGTRLLTLTGSGGCGKTRLALAAVGRVSGLFGDDVGWVWLGPVSEEDLAYEAVASAVGALEAPGLTPVEATVEHLGDRPFLLVLDNCEHLVEACADLADVLLRSCPGLKILATSRELLNVAGETAWRVPSLSLPDPRDAHDPGTLSRYEAVNLFVERAAATAPGFALTEENAGAVARVCERLDGIPLAIELAAARVKVLSVGQIAGRLDDALKLLTDGRRTSISRHRTLKAAMDWSHDLLPEDERVLLRRLAVFVGGFELEMAEAVCAGDGLAGEDVLLLLSRLVDKSLVFVSGKEGGVRYRLLTMVRQYATEKLAASGEETVIRRRHAEHLADLAARAEPELTGAGQEAWLDRLEAELGNLRAALKWALGPEAGDAEVGLGLAGSLWRFCYLRGHYREGRAWLEGALASGGSSRPARAKALAGAGVLALLRCDYEDAGRRLEEGLALYRELGDLPGEALALQFLGSVGREHGLYEKARAYHEESLALWRRLGDEAGVARSLNYLGFLAWLQEDHGRAADLCSGALLTFRRLGDAEGVAWALISLGSAALYGGDPAGARASLEESLATSRRVGYREGVAWSLNQLGVAARRAGDLDGAEKLLRESLKVHRDLGDRWRVASVLEALAETACSRGDFERAARLFGAADVLRADIGAPIPPCERGDRDLGVAAARAGLGEASFAAAMGRAATLEEAVALAARDAQDRPGRPRALPHGLSAREVEVLGLVAEGLTDAQVAEQLALSPRTVGHHLRSVYRKLRVSSRAAATKAALERGLI